MKPLCLSVPALLLALGTGAVPAASPQPVPYAAPARLPDAVETPEAGHVQLRGFLGARVDANEKNRLVKADVEPLLAGFRKKPGVHPWIGEHIGKWMHAATLAWAYSGDAELRAKLDYAAAELVKAQEPDGYLGTYTPDKRFGLYQGADWDVWSHKYNLMGLLTYYHYTGNEPALQACRKMGDLLAATFGPGKKSILSAGTHVGMAATSVLEPVVLLYRATGDDKYLEFARYIVKSWDEPNGPRIVAALLKERSVAKTANGKAYEMLSNLVGLCELARATGERTWLYPVINAWEDIAAKRLYITGGASQGEHFHGDHELPNNPGANISETCVITTWIQLNSQLLRLTGEARYGNELERTFYNHLSAAQRPDGAQWCYFTALEGTKPYGPGINCCVSSGPRGMALVPLHAYLKIPASGGQPETLAVNLFEDSRFDTRIAGQPVSLAQKTDFPRTGRVMLKVETRQPVMFGLRIRAPEWGAPVKIHATGISSKLIVQENGWIHIPARAWRNGDTVRFLLALEPRLVTGEYSNQGLAALTWGPLVLAYDAGQNPGAPATPFLGLYAYAGRPPFKPSFHKDGPLAFVGGVVSSREPQPKPATFLAFADAGADGSRYAVWLRAPGAALPRNDSVFAFASENRSRPGNVAGSIADGDLSTFVVTFKAQAANEDWFSVSVDKPVSVQRVVYAHGKSFHDGGWFDAQAGKPKVQAQRVKNGPWEDLGVLSDYPDTTATDAKSIKEGQTSTLALSKPETVLALRVIGKPAGGDNPRQAFASCAELQAFEK